MDDEVGQKRATVNHDQPDVEEGASSEMPAIKRQKVENTDPPEAPAHCETDTTAATQVMTDATDNIKEEEASMTSTNTAEPSEATIESERPMEETDALIDAETIVRKLSSAVEASSSSPAKEHERPVANNAVPDSSSLETPMDTSIETQPVYPTSEPLNMRMSVSAILSEQGRAQTYNGKQESSSALSTASLSPVPTVQEPIPETFRGHSMPPLPSSRIQNSSPVTQDQTLPIKPELNTAERSSGSPLTEPAESIPTKASLDTSNGTITNEQLVAALTSISVPENDENDTSSPSMEYEAARIDPKHEAGASFPHPSETSATTANATSTQPPVSTSTMPTVATDASSETTPTVKRTENANRSKLSVPNLAAFTSLPEISAALRRLSSSVGSMEGSRFSPMGTLATEKGDSSTSRLSARPVATTDEKSTDQASPSEILGNALAAVAASANAGRSNSTSSTAAAAAIGNLAVITANINSILHASSNLANPHRNSVSFDDKSGRSNGTGSPSMGRRKSSVASLGGHHHPLLSMLDQALSLGARGQEDGQRSENAKGGRGSIGQEAMDGVMRAAAAAMSGKLNDASLKTSMDQLMYNRRNSSHLFKAAPSGSPHRPPLGEIKKKPELIIRNDQVWKAVEGMEERSLGLYDYTPNLLLPNFEDAINGVLEVRVSGKHLSYSNTQLQKRAIWGTDIYTDDSDVVAMAIHCGKYRLPFEESNIELDDPFALAVAGRRVEAMRASKKLKHGKSKTSGAGQTGLDHDLKIRVRVLPKLRGYASSVRHHIKSRPWGGNHDGVSLHIDHVEVIKRGEAPSRGRRSLKAGLNDYETRRRQALGLANASPVVDQGRGLASDWRRIGRIQKNRSILR